QPDRYISAASSQIPANEAWQAASRGLVAGLNDRQARWLSPADLQAYQTLCSLPMNGIGAVLSTDTDGQGLVIQRVLPGHPSVLAGLQAGDRITSVDGQSTLGMGIYQGMHLLRGVSGTPVELVVERRGKSFDVMMHRAPIIPGPAVSTSMGSMGDRETGCVTVNWLDFSTADQVTAALQSLEAQGARKVLVDLRNLGGNDPATAVRICSNFVPSGTLVGRVQPRQGPEQDLRTTTGLVTSMPVTVLVNERTGGSAELVAACLRENGAQVLGEATAGQPSSVQMAMLPDGSALQLPCERWYGPDGRLLDGQGVRPHGRL
ncbi:MAG: S41 family peptidase, partial [Candidatus Eremiobacterota bacterium]